MSKTELVELSGLDFVLPVLADPTLRLDLVGVGSGDTDSEGQIDDVQVAYSSSVTNTSTLRLRTTVRRGWRLTASGAPHTIGSSLADLGEQAVRDLLLGTLDFDGGGASRREAVDEVMTASAEVGRRIPGEPWVCRSTIMDNQAFALWVLDAGENGFCLVVDWGPTVTTGVGRDVDAWDWTFRALPAADARVLLTTFSTSDE